MTRSPRRVAALRAGTLAVAALVLCGSWLAWRDGVDRRERAERSQVQLQQQRERGGALFRGEAPLSGRLVGHEQPLPAAVVRCANCHVALNTLPAAAIKKATATATTATSSATASATTRAATGATTTATTAASATATPATAAGGTPVAATPYGGALDAEALTSKRARRGAPPSAFSADGLCALLRTGVDPAHVMIATVMPRYDVSLADCNDLWAYLSHTGRRTADGA